MAKAKVVVVKLNGGATKTVLRLRKKDASKIEAQSIVASYIIAGMKKACKVTGGGLAASEDRVGQMAYQFGGEMSRLINVGTKKK